MKTLYINVLNKKATYQKRCGDIVCGNSDYQIQFTFDSEWDSQNVKTARFVYHDKYIDVVFEGNVCSVPIIKNTTSVSVGVYAGNLNTTTPAIIPCVKSILCEDGLPDEPDDADDYYAQIAKLIEEGMGKTDLPLKKGTGENSLIVNEGEANGDSAIAGGTTDTELIKSVLGGGYASLIDSLGGSINNLSDTTISAILKAVGADYTVAEFRRMINIFPSLAEGILAISLGASNKSTSTAGISLGYGNISGAKGYYITAINTTNKTITLSTKQDTTSAPSNTVNWAKGDRLFIVNDDRYFVEVVSVSGNVITLTDMPFTSLVGLKKYLTYNLTNPSERSVINLDKPESGKVAFGWGAIALGALNNILGSNAFGIGYKNLIAGDFGASFGMENTVGYSAGAIGILIQALAKATFGAGCGILLTENYQAGFGKWNKENKNALLMVGNGSKDKRSNAFEVLDDGTATMRKLIAGKGCTASGDYASSRGYETRADGWAASSEGQGTKANGDRSHAGGHYSYANHEDSFVHGKNLRTSRHRQAIFGEYNRDNANALFLIGNGVAKARSNAFEVISKNGVCSIKVGNTELTEEQLTKLLALLS